MPRLTPEELRQAKLAKEEERRKEQEELQKRHAQEQERREKAEAARQAELLSQRKRLAILHANRPKINQLSSVLDGSYNEMDKLTKKAPADEITELALKRINDVISRGKELMKGDEFIDSIDLFIAAGERPEHRDALMILGDLRQGIKRLEIEYSNLALRARSEQWRELTEGEGEEE